MPFHMVFKLFVKILVLLLINLTLASHRSTLKIRILRFSFLISTSLMSCSTANILFTISLTSIMDKEEVFNEEILLRA
jgi:hypothetical protein